MNEQVREITAIDSEKGILIGGIRSDHPLENIGASEPEVTLINST